MQTLDRTRNTKRNIVWGLANKLVALLTPFVTRTLLIYCLGAEYLGVSSLYTSVLQVLNLAELGFAAAVVYSMYKPIADGNMPLVAAYLNYFRSVYRWVGVAILAGGIIAMPLLGYLISGEVPGDVNLQLAFGIYLINTAISYFFYAYKQSLLNAYQRNDAVNKVNMVILIAQCLFQSVVLLLWANFYVFALVMLLCTIASNIATALVVRRMLPEYSDAALRDAKLEAAARSDIRSRVAGLVFQQLCSVSRNSFDNIVISAFIGLAAVACYGNYFVIMSGLLGVLGTIGTSMTAAVGNSVAIESKEKNFEDMRLFIFLYSLASIICCSCLLSCYQTFMTLWVGDDLVLPFVIPVLMSIYFYIGTMGDIRSVYVNATGIWWKLKWRALAEAVSNLVMNIILVQILGLPGVVIATILSLFLVNFLYGSHLTFKHYFGMEYALTYYVDHFIYLGVAFVSCLLSCFAASFVPGAGLLSLLLRASVALVCSCATLLVTFGWTKRFKRALDFTRGVLAKKR